LINKYNDFLYSILEKSIGSEEIRMKWYSDIDKKIFYKIVNIDPTSVRKKDFSKPGKYTKWLLNMYKSMLKSDIYRSFILEDFGSYFDSELNYNLFIFSTDWYKNKNENTDILKFKSIIDFNNYMSDYAEEYKLKTEDSKYDIIYSDNNIDILIPLNFSASYETAKNTDWCSIKNSGFSLWKQMSLMFRIIPKDSKYDKLKLTWTKKSRSPNMQWYIACSKYPEINGEGNPFDNFEEKLEFLDSLEIKNNIKNTMSLITDEAKKLVIKYYESNQ